METMDRRAPQAREEELLVHELADETLVYDLKRHRAHSLNRTATLVWRQCDGKTTVAEMARVLQQELNLPPDEEVVWLVLNRLGRAHLLRERVTPLPDAQSYSRREVVRKLGMAGGLALVVSIVAPKAAQAATCFGNGACPTGTTCCKSTQTCTGWNGKVCAPGENCTRKCCTTCA